MSDTTGYNEENDTSLSNPIGEGYADNGDGTFSPRGNVNTTSSNTMTFYNNDIKDSQNNSIPLKVILNSDGTYSINYRRV